MIGGASLQQDESSRSFPGEPQSGFTAQSTAGPGDYVGGRGIQDHGCGRRNGRGNQPPNETSAGTKRNLGFASLEGAGKFARQLRGCGVRTDIDAHCAQFRVLLSKHTAKAGGGPRSDGSDFIVFHPLRSPGDDPQTACEGAPGERFGHGKQG